MSAAKRPPYRKVVAALEECEERYTELVASINSAADSRLAATIATLKREIKFRRHLEADLLTAVESERQRIGQDLHDDLCQRLGATALMVGSLANQIEVLDKNLGEKVRSIAPLMAETIESCRRREHDFIYSFHRREKKREINVFELERRERREFGARNQKA